jgi:hypothetical protein
MIGRASLLLILLSTPAAAEIPTIDATVLNERQDRNEGTAEINRVNRDRHLRDEGVTCAIYRPGRRDDPVSAANSNPAIARLVRRIAREQGIDENQFLALVYQESRFNPCAKSAAGAIGLAQLMPGTASDLGVSPYKIEENLRGGALYFRRLLRDFHGNVPLALAAYNSGPGNVENYGGIPPFRETQAYVRNITQRWLPAFGSSDKSAIALSFGGTSEAYESMRASTLYAMGLTRAISDGSQNVASWFEQFGDVATSTVQESWKQNSDARNANIEMLNRMIELTSSFAELVNSRNAMTLGDISGASRSGHYLAIDGASSPSIVSRCENRVDFGWDKPTQRCVRQPNQSAGLLLVPQ